MKCVRCGADVRYKDRPGGKCGRCGKYFAFEPKRGDPITDRAFQDAIETLSGRGRLKWGVEHLYWELARRRARKVRGGEVGCSVFAGFLAVLFVSLAYGAARGFAWPALVAILLFGWLLTRVLRSGRASRELSVEKFNELWKRWIEVHRRPGWAILRQEKSERAARPPEGDLFDYSFDRVVVCDRARTVDLLIANNFHFENNCAVLSIAGYPEAVFEPVRAMLKRNRKLEVFALHDATPFGCRVAYRLATDPAWFKGGGRVVDVGLRPRHVSRHKDYWLASEVSAVEEGGGLSKQEAAWLARYRVELAVYRPEAILRALFRAINHREELALPSSPHSDATGDTLDDSFDSFG